MQIQNANNNKIQNFGALRVEVAKGIDTMPLYKKYAKVIGSQVTKKDGTTVFNVATRADSIEEASAILDIENMTGHKVNMAPDQWWAQA